ncbi:MAG: hypothetical protein QF796_05895 [Acidimicrobiales bacterium]|nr:hypothetical protein [Acidimicrobiales bacterium]
MVRMLGGTTRPSDEVVALIPPNLVEGTVEKVAVNAVMAGCRPEYLPVVLAALEAICTDEFNMHGVLATTMSVGPILVVNGPIAAAIGMNSGINVLGHGNRANSSIGRAVQLVLRNLGGGAPGGIDRATLGHMGKQGICFAEDEAGSPWNSLAEERGFDRSQSTVTAFCGEGPHLVVDQLSRSPESLTRSLAASLRSAVSPRLVLGMDGMLVLSPEHMARYRDAGWDRARFLAELTEYLMFDTDEIIAGADGIEEGLPPGLAGHRLPKFRPGGLLVVHAGGPAGLFSAIIGGWISGPGGSDPVTREITP